MKIVQNTIVNKDIKILLNVLYEWIHISVKEFHNIIHGRNH